jgi:hypothetical protein
VGEEGTGRSERKHSPELKRMSGRHKRVHMHRRREHVRPWSRTSLSWHSPRASSSIRVCAGVDVVERLWWNGCGGVVSGRCGCERLTRVDRVI